MMKKNVVKELRKGALSKTDLFQRLDYGSKTELSSELIRLQAAGEIERQDAEGKVLYGLPIKSTLLNHKQEYILTREMRNRLTQGRSVKACRDCCFFGVISNSVKKCPDCGGELFKPNYVLESETPPHETEKEEVIGEEAGGELESEAELEGGEELLVSGGVADAEYTAEETVDKLATELKQAKQRYTDAEATIAELKRDVERLRGMDAPEAGVDSLELVEIIERRIYKSRRRSDE